MKLMIASDIHGSEKWAGRLVEEYKKSGAEKLVLLGDVLYHGPRNSLTEGHNPQGVISILNDLAEEIISVRGNCDAEVDQMVLAFDIMEDYECLEDGDRTLWFTHGHIYSVDYFPKAKEGDIVIQGHTHIPMDEMRCGIRCVNPGSVSLPKGGSDRQCLLYEDGEFKTVKL